LRRSAVTAEPIEVSPEPADLLDRHRPTEEWVSRPVDGVPVDRL
jgi:hypothetical protein